MPHEYNVRFFLYYRKDYTIGRTIYLHLLFRVSSIEFWVNEPQEISSDVVAVKLMSQLLVLLIFYKRSC